jgi:hypothetical protein
MSDRLLRIKANASVGVKPSLDDFKWMVAEIERVRDNPPAVKGDLAEIFDRSEGRDAQTIQDIDWLIGQVAMLRQKLRGAQNGD